MLVEKTYENVIALLKKKLKNMRFLENFEREACKENEFRELTQLYCAAFAGDMLEYSILKEFGELEDCGHKPPCGKKE